MATHYHIYVNNSLGGPVDYSTVIATTTTPTYVGPALASPSDTTFAVRAFDTVSGLEEQNRAAIVRVVIDSGGVNVSARPNPPMRLSARVLGGGRARIVWAYNPAGQGGAPTSFKVWATAGGTVNYAAPPAVTVPFSTLGPLYTATLTGLADGVAYSVGVRATNAAGDEANTARAAFTAEATGPAAVEVLAAGTTDAG